MRPYIIWLWDYGISKISFSHSNYNNQMQKNIYFISQMLAVLSIRHVISASYKNTNLSQMSYGERIYCKIYSATNTKNHR